MPPQARQRRGEGSGFRLNTKQFFLTYAQVPEDMTLENVYDYLKDWTKETRGVLSHKVEKLLVAEERHEDGGKHFHVYMALNAAYNLTNPRVFDIMEQHPNVQGCRSPKKVIEYVSKGGNFKANFNIKIGKDAGYIKLFDTCESAQEFLDKVIYVNPMAIHSYPALERFAHKKWGEKCLKEPVRDFETFINVPDEITDFKDKLATYSRGDRRGMKSLWVYGPSMLGKTQLVRSIGVHCYMQSLWNLACIDDNADYAVFDDIPWDSIKWQYKALLGRQENINFTGKYKPSTSFKWGIPAIMVTNEYPDNLTLADLDWFDKNVIFVNINQKLYDD